MLWRCPQATKPEEEGSGTDTEGLTVSGGGEGCSRRRCALRLRGFRHALHCFNNGLWAQTLCGVRHCHFHGGFNGEIAKDNSEGPLVVVRVILLAVHPLLY